MKTRYGLQIKLNSHFIACIDDVRYSRIMKYLDGIHLWDKEEDAERAAERLFDRFGKFISWIEIKKIIVSN